MATLANIFTLKLENKDFNAQLQTAAKTSQDYNNKIANSLLEAAKLQAQLVQLTKEKADAQLAGDKATIKSINQQISVTKTLMQVEDQRIREANRNISIQSNLAKEAMTQNQKWLNSTKQREETISSLNAQRVSEEKARYQTLSSLAAQKTKELADLEIQNAKRRNDVLSSLNAQRVSEEKARYQTLSSLAAQKTKEAEEPSRLRAGFESTYVNSGAQNKYNASLAELNSLKSQGIISEVEYSKALKKTNETLKEGEPIRNNQFNHMIRMMRWAGTLAAAFYGVKTAWDATIGTGLDTAAQFEQMQIGISALIATNSQSVTSMGRQITASEKFAMAQKDAANAILLLRKANIDTPATLEQLTRGFQSALGPAMALGFNINQTVEYSKLMTLAASALTVPMEQLSQEMRSILNGTIDQNSIVANSLGLTNAQIKAHKQQGDVYEFLIGKLSDFNSAGKEVNQSWQGISSNLSDAWKAFTSDTVKSQGIFDGLKSGMSDLTVILKNQNGELDTLSKYFKEIGIAVTAYYSVTLLGTGVTALRAIAVETKAATVAQTLFNTAVRANAWVVTAGLIATTVTYLYEYKSLLDDIRGSEAKSAGASGFLKDLGFISGKSKVQQVHDLVTRSNELLKEQKILVNEYNKAWYEASSKGFEGKSKADIKARIDAITEEQKAIKKYLATPGARPTTKPKETLLPKPEEKSAEELAKEEKAKAKAIADAQRESTREYMVEKQKLEAQLAKEDMDTARKALEGHETEIAQLKTKYVTKFQLQANAEKGLAEELSLINEKGITEREKESERAKAQREYFDTTKSFYTWVSNALKSQTDEYEKQIKAADKAAYLFFDRETAVSQRGVNNKDRGIDWTTAFSKNKISMEEYTREVDSLITNYMSASMETSDIEGIAKLDNLFQSKLDFWKDKLAEIPDIKLKMSITGVDNITSSLAEAINTIGGLTEANKTYNKLVEEGNSRKKLGMLTQEEEIKLGKLTTQNTYDNVEAYKTLAGVVSGAFSQGSKEAAAFTLIQQGLALTNAVSAIATAGMSSPWTGLATAAAMAAYLRPMLATIGVALGAGGVSTSYDTFAAQAANTGTGSVLGDTSAQSESISNSLNILSDMAKPEFRLISQMNKSLISIDQKIGGLSANILRAAGFATGEGYIGSSTPEGTTTQMLQTALLTGGVGVAITSLNGILKDIPVIGQVSNLITGAINSLVGGIFGGDSETSLQDAGITFADQLLAAAIAGLEGQSYQVTRTVTDGGWFRGDSESYNSYFSQLDDYTRRQFQLVIDSLYDTTVTAGGALGITTGTIESELSDFVVSLGKISLKDKTGEQIQKDLTSIFGNLGDELVKEAFKTTEKFVYDVARPIQQTGEFYFTYMMRLWQWTQGYNAALAEFEANRGTTLDAFQQIGEGLYETMTRVSGGMQEAGYYIDRLGNKFSDVAYTDILNKQGDVALEALRQSIMEEETNVVRVSNRFLIYREQLNNIGELIKTFNGSVDDLYSFYTTLGELQTAFSVMGVSTTSLTSNMLYGAGGVEALSDATQSYMEIFFTDGEKLSYKARSLRESFTSLGLQLPVTNQGFIDLLHSIDVSTESGQELYGRVILLSSGFGEFSDQLSRIYEPVRTLSDAFSNLSKSLGDTINTLLSAQTGTGVSTTRNLIGQFWSTRGEIDSLLAKKGDLTTGEQERLQGLIGSVSSLSTSIQSSVIGANTAMTGSLVTELGNVKEVLDLQNTVLKTVILNSNGSETDIATEGTLTQLVSALAGAGIVLPTGALPSFDVGSPYLPTDMVVQVHKGEMIIDAQTSRALRKYGLPSMGGGSSIDTRPLLGSINDKLEAVVGYMKRLDKNFETVMQGNRLRTVV